MKAPFFIVGCGRSGTTLLRAMLDSHPAVAIPVESLFLVDYLRGRAVPPAELRRRIRMEPELAEWGRRFTDRELAGCHGPKAVCDRIHALYAASAGATRWGQKTPRFVRFGHLLKRHYPEARFLHVVRDPRAVAASLIRSEAHWSNAYFAARRWRKDVSAGRALADAYPDDVLPCSYEALVREPETTLRAVCAFLELAFDDAMLGYAERATRVYGRYRRRIHARLASPPDPRRIDAWRGELSLSQRAAVEAVAGPLMEPCGYTRETAARPVSRPRRVAASLDMAARFAGKLAHTVRTRPRYVRTVVARKAGLGLWGDLLRIHD